MNIAVVGTGYVGLVSGTCFAEMGVNVTCVDIDCNKIQQLEQGIVTLYEPGLEQMLKRNISDNRLHFVKELKSILNDVEIVFCAVGTPSLPDGSADLQYVLEVAREFGQNITKYAIFVTKSTVPVGTSQKIKAIIKEELNKRGREIEFDVVSNPEFLKEGNAIKDFMSPDRVVIGVENQRALDIMSRLYRPFMLNNNRIIYTDIISAEMIKYAANSMLATRISFMNEIANLCDLVGADVNVVRKGIGSDKRIGMQFLYPGCGYGGSCFPKDVKALIKTAEKAGYDLRVLKAVEDVNEYQKSVLFEKLVKAFGGEANLKGKKIAVWGLAFKPETDDMREATALVMIDLLKKAGCEVSVYDPAAMDECRRRLGDVVNYAKDMYDAVLDADALLLLTEWKQFRLPSWGVVKHVMRGNLVLDGRNIYDPAEMASQKFVYHCIGRNI